MVKTIEDLERVFKLMGEYGVATVEIPTDDGTGSLKISMAFDLEPEPTPPASGIGFSAQPDVEDEDDPSPDGSAIKSLYDHPALPRRIAFPGAPLPKK